MWPGRKILPERCKRISWFPHCHQYKEFFRTRKGNIVEATKIEIWDARIRFKRGSVRELLQCLMFLAIRGCKDFIQATYNNNWKFQPLSLMDGKNRDMSFGKSLR